MVGGGVDHGGLNMVGDGVDLGHHGLVDFSVSLGIVVQSLGGLYFGGLLRGDDTIAIVFHMVNGLSHSKSEDRGQNLTN